MGVSRESSIVTIVRYKFLKPRFSFLQFKKLDETNDNLCKYNPKFDSIDKNAQNFKFLYGLKNEPKTKA